jgi:hypothetical protein
MRTRTGLVITLFTGLLATLALSAPASAVKASDSIWVTTSNQLHYGDTFSAGWQSKLNNPSAYAKCWTTDPSIPFWDAWGRLQTDGTLGVFQFYSVDPEQVWPASGGTCTVSLVSSKGSVTATSTAFTVIP